MTSPGPTSSSQPAAPQTNGESVAKESAKESFSQLLARILDQLSTTAWLPSAALVSGLVLLRATWSTQGDASAAIGMIAETEPTQLVLIVLAVVLATTVAQAFEFAAIQTLEGYWGPVWPMTALAAIACAWMTRKRRRLLERATRLSTTLAQQVYIGLSDQSDVTDAQLRETVAAVKRQASHPERVAANIDWQQHTDWNQLRVVGALNSRVRDFPENAHRVMPTRLGNTLRSWEDRLRIDDPRGIQGYIDRVFHRLPKHMQQGHDLWRQRLDMYASLSFIFTALGAIAAATLGLEFSERTDVWVIVAALAVLARLAYLAAVAAARGYGATLETIRDWELNNPVSI